MPTQAQNDWENVVNTNRSKDLRASREISRARKDKMNDALRNATSTKDRRAIKKQFNVDTNKASSQTDNQAGVNEDSNQRGDDVFKPSYRDDPEGGGGGGLNEGYLVMFADEESRWIDSSKFGGLARSIALNIVAGVPTKDFAGSLESRSLWSGTGATQTTAYIPIDYLSTEIFVAEGGVMSTGGMYRETTLCVNGEPTITFVRV